MLKAVFLDYTGTIVQEYGREVKEIVTRCCQNSDAENPQQILSSWWEKMKEFEEASFGDSYLTEDEIVDRLLDIFVKEFHLKENLDELHKLFQKFWVSAPLFDDVKEFFDKCPLPVYIISNNGIEYIQDAMKEKNLHPAGIISSDMVRAYKPHKEIFLKALEVSGCSADEVIHVGDSVTSDVQGALSAGIRPVLLDRKGEKQSEQAVVVSSFDEVLELIS